MSARHAAIAIGAFSLAAAVTAYAGPPLQIPEAGGFDNPATVYADPAPVTSKLGDAFPWAINEAGFDNPATVFPERVYVRSAGSPFPWTVNEAGPYVAEIENASEDSATHTARR